MSTSVQTPSVGIAGQQMSTRVVSIDIFRGLVMALMIFVNELSGVHGLPWWNYHAKASVDAMTYVDMVFPAFLFIVGMAIPLAIKQRLKRNASMPRLWMHVILRSISLIVMGLILANDHKGDAARMGLSHSAWGLLGLTGAVLFWSVYSGSESSGKVHKSLRLVGLALLVAMYAIFRRVTNTGEVGWIDGSYPEILGLIGYTYFAVCLLYIPTRRISWAPVAWFVALTAFCALCTARIIVFPHHLPLYFFPFGNGAMASLTMAGIIVSSIFLGTHRWQTVRQKMALAAGFGVAMLVAGFLLTPLGISKIRATPTWCLYTIGACSLLFTLLYWVCDVRKKTKWAFFVRAAGSNTLLTYLLPDFYYYITGLVGFAYFNSHLNYGWPGVLRAIVFTAVMLGLATLLTKWKVRLQL
jgi:heparan-alpha-glucosaminide N-acetyltransferase